MFGLALGLSMIAARISNTETVSIDVDPLCETCREVKINMDGSVSCVSGSLNPVDKKDIPRLLSMSTETMLQTISLKCDADQLIIFLENGKSKHDKLLKEMMVPTLYGNCYVTKRSVAIDSGVYDLDILLMKEEQAAGPTKYSFYTLTLCNREGNGKGQALVLKKLSTVLDLTLFLKNMKLEDTEDIVQLINSHNSANKIVVDLEEIKPRTTKLESAAVILVGATKQYHPIKATVEDFNALISANIISKTAKYLECMNKPSSTIPTKQGNSRGNKIIIAALIILIIVVFGVLGKYISMSSELTKKGKTAEKNDGVLESIEIAK
jgi:hypothetical protein